MESSKKKANLIEDDQTLSLVFKKLKNPIVVPQTSFAHHLKQMDDTSICRH